MKSSKAGNLGSIGSNRRELTDTELEPAKLKRELAKVKMERDILKKAAAYSSLVPRLSLEGVDMRYATIEELRLQYPVTDPCHQLRVSESGYYGWRSRPPSQRKRDDEKLKVVISAAHKHTWQTCGPERLQKNIAEQEGVVIGVHRIKRLRKETGIAVLPEA